jgi:hypothetical protein
MSDNYTTQDWLNATQGVEFLLTVPGESGESTTITASGIAQTSNAEFDQFADLTAKLFQVPKSAVQD